MAMQMPPPSPRTEKRRLTGAPEELEVLASPSKRGTPTSRSFFSAGPEAPRTPADVSWIREQAGSTPRALDREFLEANSGVGTTGGSTNNNGRGFASSGNSSGTSSTGGKSKMYNRRTWTKEENEQLQQGISAMGGSESDMGKNEWNAIASDFLKSSRTGTQCATHWKMVLKPALLKGVWSPEEDAVIYDSVARGVTDWNEVAALLPKRKAKHCRERWNNHLDPSLSKGEWTAAEEAKLLAGVEAHGTSWTHIARLLPGRSEPMIQQHWNAVVFRNAASAGGVRRSRSKMDPVAVAPMPGSNSAYAGMRSRPKPSTLPIELLPQPLVHSHITRDGQMTGNGGDGGARSGGGGAQVFMGRDAGATPGAALTEREKALMDHAFKTGLTAAGGGGAGVGVAPPEVIDAISKGGGIEQLSLTASGDDDAFAPLSAALLKGEGSDIGCSPDMPPPSPTTSPLVKPQKRVSDCSMLGHELGDAWGVDEDPALADLYRSLDNIGESLFNEDNFELSFDFDSVDKPAAASSAACAPACSASPTNNQASRSGGTPPSWENLLPSGQEQKEVSPFRRAAAQAAAVLEKQRFSPTKQRQRGQGLQTAYDRATAAARAASASHGQGLSSGSAAASTSVPAPDPGPRVKQGFLRRLLLMDSNKFGTRQSSSRAPFATIRGCLSEANAPLPPAVPVAPPGSPAGGIWAPVGENRAPWRSQSLSTALFAVPPLAYINGNGDDVVTIPTLKHGKAEVQVPRLVSQSSSSSVGGMGAGLGPLSALPPSRFNGHHQEGVGEYGWPPEEPGGQN